MSEEMKIRRYESAVKDYPRKASERIIKLEHNWNELKKCIKDEIEKTENLIKEDCNMIQINNIRKMLNEDRECWLYKISELEEGGNNDC